MRGYDAWLSAPYEAQADEQAAYESWCDDQGMDPSDGDSVVAWEDHLAEGRY